MPNSSIPSSNSSVRDDILFALPCSGDCEISDEMYQEVIQFAEFVAQRKAANNKEP